MNCWSTRVMLPALLLALLAGSAYGASDTQQKLYRWVDKNGQVHYGDSIPPEYAEQDRDVLNRHGVAVGHEEGLVTPEEARAKAAADKAAKDIQIQKQRDRTLLQVYQSVEEIEVLRDRRLELIEAQLTIQQQSLANLRAKHIQLEKQAARFLPRSQEPDAQPLPDELKLDLQRSASDIATQQQNLDKKRVERETIRTTFGADIKRFRELKAIGPR
ncbi:MAG: DUF4124 domain-containing protein [Gammaproteobacteria bacterium]|nr:DUF4124 domain-containing protein [Gammaproteobacteria bacterium]